MPRHPPCALSSLTSRKPASQVFDRKMQSIFLPLACSIRFSLLQSCSNHFWVPLDKILVRQPFRAGLPFCFFTSSLFSSQGTPAFRFREPPGNASHFPATSSAFAFLWLLAFGFPFREPVTFRPLSLRTRIAAAPAAGGLKWTRTIDLTLIRRAL